MQILEYFPGETLRDLLNSGEVFSHLDIGIISVQICDALSVIHNFNLIHEDLRPENILINSQGEVKLKGILIPEVLVNYSKIPECWNYIAPEQISKSVWISPGPKANSYSLGAIIYELLIGKKYGKSFEEIDSFIKNSKDPILSLRSQIESFSKTKINLQIPEEFSRILSNSLSPEAEGRLSVRDISELLTVFINKSFTDVPEEPSEPVKVNIEENPDETIKLSEMEEPSLSEETRIADYEEQDKNKEEQDKEETFSPQVKSEEKEPEEQNEEYEYENDTKIINSEVIEEILLKENEEKQKISETADTVSPISQEKYEDKEPRSDEIKQPPREERYEVEQIYDEETYENESAEIKEFIPSVAGGFFSNDTYEKLREVYE
jgi:serine/threonine protein kinase